MTPEPKKPKYVYANIEGGDTLHLKISEKGLDPVELNADELKTLIYFLQEILKKLE